MFVLFLRHGVIAYRPIAAKCKFSIFSHFLVSHPGAQNPCQFLPHDATQSAVLLRQVVCSSVRLSVRLSVRNVEV